jgi:hypothetical protein
VLTPDEISARTARAVAAAAAAGRDLGLRVDEPRVLYDVFSVIVHLAPSPVVVRVPTVLPPSRVGDPDAVAAQQRRELAVTGWLAARGHPVVPPSPLVPPEPVQRDGFSMTFWRLVEVIDVSPDYPSRVAQTAELHAALLDYEGDLEFWAPYGTYIPEGLTALEHLGGVVDRADLQRAQREWSVLGPVLTSRSTFEAAFPHATVQPIHGDAPFHNMLTTPDGELWSDFELVTLGAVESDLAMVGPDALPAYDTVAHRLGLRPLDPAILRITEAAAHLAVVSCLAMAPQLPMLIDGVAPTLEAWRATPEFTAL